MKDKYILQDIINPLLQWYQKNARVLPWRYPVNAYHVWLSEVMLQQTRIEAVKRYYDRFLQELPTIRDLANVSEERLLKLWEGLGYYNRARNLKKAAIKIEQDYQGKMPTSYRELLNLPGIGEYTAGAIASIVYNEPVPAVDGNVLRVIARITGNKKDILMPNTKKEITKQLQEIMPKEAGMFNQALMELGELICIPKGMPLCEECPLKKQCIAKVNNLVKQIPVRQNKIKRKQEKRTVFLLRKKKQIAIQQRENIGLLANLYEFPNVENWLKEKEIKDILKQWKLKIKQLKKVGEYKHVFSHIEWHMLVYEIDVVEINELFIWVNREEIWEEYAIPSAFTFLKEKL